MSSMYNATGSIMATAPVVEVNIEIIQQAIIVPNRSLGVKTRSFMYINKRSMDFDTMLDSGQLLIVNMHP